MGIIEDFLRYQSLRGLSQRTIERRRWSLTHLERFGTPIPIEGTNREVVEEFLMRWPSAQSRYSVRSDIHQFFRWAISRDLAEHDPTTRIEAPRLPQRAATPLRAEDLELALSTAEGDVLLMLALGAYAGLRISEIAALCGRDVDAERLVVRGGKGGKDRVVPLAPVLAQLLRGCPSGPLFPGCNGQAIGARIRRHFRRLDIAARPHDLRHSFGTDAAKRAGGNVLAVMRLMGHRSTAATLRYVLWTPEGAEIVAHLHEPPSVA